LLYSLRPKLFCILDLVKVKFKMQNKKGHREYSSIAQLSSLAIDVA
jgi:hypothetical protein